MPKQDIKIRDMKKVFKLPESRSIQLTETKFTKSKDDIKTPGKEKYIDFTGLKIKSLNNLQKSDDSFNKNKYIFNENKKREEKKVEIRRVTSKTVDRSLTRENILGKDILERERER
jgi:hypothetical protein